MSEEKTKSTIPGKKMIYRMKGKDGICILDLMELTSEPAPHVGEKVFLCMNRFIGIDSLPFP